MARKIWATDEISELQFDSEADIPQGWIPHKRLKRSLESRQKQSESTKGRPGYWKGKKMPSDGRGETLHAQFASGTRVQWNLGLKNDPRCKGPSPGTTPWNKGLTEETDIRVANNLKGWRNGESQRKSHNTKKQNGSFKNRGTQPEKIIQEYLLTKYDANDIETQYRDDRRYPFNCDFYIKSEDLFIEVNAFWHHGPHPFDKNNLEDQKILTKWKNKSKDKDQFTEAIYTWTIRDIKKFEYAKKYNLKYKTIYFEEVQRLSKELTERNIQYNNRVE